MIWGCRNNPDSYCGKLILDVGLWQAPVGGEFQFLHRSPSISKSCNAAADRYDGEAMRNLAILFVHLLATIAKLIGRGNRFFLRAITTGIVFTEGWVAN